LDQIQEIADEYRSDGEIEEKILEDLKFAVEMEIFQRSSAISESFNPSDFDYDGD
jgi:hypothetical protein